jgi:uncharacterized membrane protein YcaP (DUF421 family)
MHMLDLMWKSVVIYVALILFMRLMGKRQLGDLEVSELIVTVLISEVASAPLVEQDATLADGLVPLGTLFLLEFILSNFTVKSVKLRHLLSGNPSILVTRGQVNQSQMKKNRFTPDELMESLRNQGVLDISSVEYAILETDGRLNIILTPGNRTVTAGQLGIDTSDSGYPVIVINSGRVLTKNLSLLGRDETWLTAQLQANGLRSAKDVYMMTADMAGEVFLVQKKD